MMSTIVKKRLLIGASWFETGVSFPVKDKTTGAVLAEVPLGNIQTIEDAVAAADKAFEKTRLDPPYVRAELLRRVVSLLESCKGDFVRLIVAEAGKPVVLAESEVNRAITTFTIAAEEARRMEQESVPLDAFASGKGHVGLTRRFPVGVIAGITPFNFPLNLVAHKVAPCLATGNCMVLKPSTKTPLSALLLGAMLMEAGMQPGQVNIITCSNEDSDHLVFHPKVKMISFTGSPAVGWRIKERAGRKRVALELGGNAAVVVHEDADLDKAASMISSGAFGYAGQSCISVQRILVHQPVYGEFKESLLARTRFKVKTGNPKDRHVIVGPMIDSEASRRVLEWIKEAQDRGAGLLCGGTLEESCLTPTLLENVNPRCKIYSQEAFAPVAVLQPYDEFIDALEMVNASEYGLQAGVFTRDIGRAMQAFSQLEVGGVIINNVPTWRVENMPYGGVKSSGVGREGVKYAMEEMTEPKLLVMNVG